MIRWLKLLIFFLTILLLTCFIVTYIVYLLNKERLTELVRKEIADKTHITIQFSKLDISFIRSFPKSTVFVEDFLLCYSSEKKNDTLLFSKDLAFRFSLVDVFKGNNKIENIDINNGVIKIDYTKFRKIIDNKNFQSDEGGVDFSLHNISIKNTGFTYTYSKTFWFKSYLSSTKLNGLYSNSFEYDIMLKIKELSITNESYQYTINNQILGNLKVRGDSVGLLINKGRFSVNSIVNSFSLKYAYVNELLQFDIKSEKEPIKKILKTFGAINNIDIKHGYITYSLLYRGSFLNLNKQRLTIHYKIQDVLFKKGSYNINVVSLNGLSQFVCSINNNSTEIDQLHININGFRMQGNAKIKDYPKPLLLLDLKISCDMNQYLFQDALESGRISGNIKSLVKVNNIDSLNFNNINIIKINSNLSLSNLVLKQNKDLKDISGNIAVHNNESTIYLSGKYLNSSFNSKISLTNFLDVIKNKHKANPYIHLSIDSLNADSLINSESNKNASIKSYYLNASIKNLYFKGNRYSDVYADINFNNGNFNISNFSLNVFSGTLAGSIDLRKDNSYKGFANFKRIDLSELFKGYNDFGQSFIKGSTLKGTVSGTADFSYRLSSTNTFDINSLALESNLKIEKGSITNTDQFKNISSFIKLNEFGSINFNNIENSISIRDGKILIPSMTISSNAFTIDIFGEHFFTGNYTFWLKFNLNDYLSKRYRLNNKIETSTPSNNQEGINLFLKLSGNSTSYKVQYDSQNSMKNLRQKVQREASTLKSIIKSEFQMNHPDSAKNKVPQQNKLDTSNNNKKKSTFIIEWEEIDTIKQP